MPLGLFQKLPPLPLIWAAICWQLASVIPQYFTIPRSNEQIAHANFKVLIFYWFSQPLFPHWTSEIWMVYCGETYIYKHLAQNSMMTPRYGNTFHINAPYYWPFVRGIHQWLVDSPLKGPVMWSFVVLFAVSLNKPVHKQWSCLWSVIPWQSFVIIAMTSGIWKICSQAHLYYLQTPCQKFSYTFFTLRNILTHQGINKRLSFCRKYFKCIFLKRKILHFDCDFSELYVKVYKQAVVLVRIVTKMETNFIIYQYINCLNSRNQNRSLPGWSHCQKSQISL